MHPAAQRLSALQDQIAALKHETAEEVRRMSDEEIVALALRAEGAAPPP